MKRIIPFSLLTAIITFWCFGAMAQASELPGIRCYNSRQLMKDLPRTEAGEPGDTPFGPPPGPHDVGDHWDWYTWQFGMMVLGMLISGGPSPH